MVAKRGLVEQALTITAVDEPGMMYRLTKVLAEQEADITHVDLSIDASMATVYFEVRLAKERVAPMLTCLADTPGVRDARETPSVGRIYGKRIIVMGGGAQVGQVAMGAISEADRHNIRGERISVDTIPLVGEKALATAVRGVMRLPRVRILVLAGALMGGEIAVAVEQVRANGLRVISLNMAGSVPDAADLVVTDPVQEGVLAVMAVSDTAQFDLLRQARKRY